MKPWIECSYTSCPEPEFPSFLGSSSSRWASLCRLTDSSQLTVVSFPWGRVETAWEMVDGPGHTLADAKIPPTQHSCTPHPHSSHRSLGAPLAFGPACALRPECLPPVSLFGHLPLPDPSWSLINCSSPLPSCTSIKEARWIPVHSWGPQ